MSARETTQAPGAPCGCCGTVTIPPTEEGEEGWYCEGCGAAWTTPTGPDKPMSCLLHKKEGTPK